MRDDGPKTTAVVRRHTTMPTIPMNYTRKNWALAPHTYFTQISVCVCERLARYAYEQPHSLEVWQHNTNNSACNCMCIGFCRVRYAPAGLLHSSTLHVCVCVCADKARGFAYVLICRRRFCLSGLSHATLIYQCLVIVHANVDCMNRCNRECQTLEHTFHAFLSYAPIFLFFAARKTNNKPFPLSLEEKIYDFL